MSRETVKAEKETQMVIDGIRNQFSAYSKAITVSTLNRCTIQMYKLPQYTVVC